MDEVGVGFGDVYDFSDGDSGRLEIRVGEELGWLQATSRHLAVSTSKLSQHY